MPRLFSGNNPHFIATLSSSSSYPNFSRPTWAEIKLSRLIPNARILRGARRTPLIAVIKANAYGHGAEQVARVLEEEVSLFAVASVDEGQRLREAGITAPLLLLSAILPDEAEAALRWDLMPTLSTPDVAQALNEAAKIQNKTARAHWNIDTGMGRVGTWHKNAPALLAAWREYSHLQVCGIYTHFACADEDDEMTLLQNALFEKTLRDCASAVPGSGREYSRHAANSAGALRFPQMHHDAIRCGIALYGASPFGIEKRDENLQPVMSLRARVTEVRRIKKGRSVSYGATWNAPRDSVLALVPIGYADGYRRCLSNRGEVLLRGKRCPIVGRVTMDQILVDVTENSPNVAVGEIVTAWGEDENGVLLPVEEVAAKAETIAYEILCGVSARVPRVYDLE
jgi:alanine racemase